jgi:hypothetical protein
MQLLQCTFKCASITQMHTNAPHKHTLAPRRLNCVRMHLQSQNLALNSSHLHQCLLKHSKCTQPTQIKCSMNQMCTNTPQWLKSRLTMLECAHMHIQCFQIPPKSTNQALVHLQTPNGLQNLKAPPKLFKTPPRLKSASKTLKVQTCTSNTHKPSRFLSMHTSNQTSNHVTRMCGPITYWKLQRLYASNATIIKLWLVISNKAWSFYLHSKTIKERMKDSSKPNPYTLSTNPKVATT